MTAIELRKYVEEAIRALAEAVERRHARTDELSDEATIENVRRAACEAVGIEISTYRLSLEEDASLVELERAALLEAIVGTSDPGPNDAISRESASGQPGDLRKGRSERVRRLMYS